jgi:YVTN family beta-propeller protein
VAASQTSQVPASTTPLTTPVDFNAIYVVNGGDSSISVINADTNVVAGTIRIKNGDFPHHVNLSPDKSRLAVSIPGMDLSKGHHQVVTTPMPGALLILDARTGATLTSKMFENMNHNGAWSPDGSEVWTSQMMTPGTVLVLNASNLSTKQTIPVGDMPEEVSFSADGSRVFVANGMSNNVTVIDASTKQVLKTIDVGKGPVGAWAGSDGVMYVNNEEGQSLTAIKADTLEVLRTYALGFMPGMVATPPSPDGSLWITSEDQGQVEMNMTSMNHDMGRIDTGAGAHGVKFSDDGNTVYVTNQAANAVSVITLTATGVSVTATVNVGQKPNGLVYRAK